MQKTHSPKAIIVGATSGIGLAYTTLLLQEGWSVGIAGRRTHALESLQQQYPHQVVIQTLDVQSPDASDLLLQLIEQRGGMDCYVHVSGIGKQNRSLSSDIEIETLRTNGEGFVRLVSTAFQYFARQGKGHIAVVSSIAGTKGIGIAPAYSATKRLQNTYIDALDQLAHIRRLSITFTDIRPGFVKTELLNDNYPYPMQMQPDTVAKAMHRAISRRKRVAVIDWRYRLLTFLWKCLPLCLWRRMRIG